MVPSTLVRVAGVLLAAMASLASLRAEVPFLADYDLETQTGVLVAEDPAGKGLVVHRVPGRMLADQVELCVGGRPAWLLLWQGFPNGTERFPELWTLDPDRVLRMVWPPNPEFYWIAPTVKPVRRPDQPEATFLEIRRELPPPGLKGASAFTRERLRLAPDGVALVDKVPEPWTDERQLVAIVEDLLLTGELGRIEAVLARHQERVGPLSPAVGRHLVAMATTQARWLGIPQQDLTAVGAPAVSIRKEGDDDGRN